ncbi:peroxisomal sarcosine oxidase [Trichonephila inaurata madagascariensis]|uniref:Peroxisomal sarcosine oxidase n=1 Tax=Trichonephila inaurata madagascariensis TaxID=2747483 RepID=A0A8X7C7Y0_9ARAC|nr:peroxisomal sarcosine oxidase [Trichonephila inaurata madagascariensis]
MGTYDLCIIGAGMFGSSAARHASTDPSLRVCLVGPNEPTISAQDTLILSPFAGIQFYHPVGTLLGALKGSLYLQNWLTDLETAKVPFVDFTNEDTLKKRYTFLQLDDCYHFFLDDNGAGYINPRSFVEAQKKVAELQGCDILNDVVNEVVEKSSRVHEIVTEKKKVIRARRLLFCTGAFTKFKNLHPVKNLKMSVHKETAALLQVSEPEQRRLSSMPPIMIYKKEIEGMPSTTTGVYIMPPIQYPDKKYYLKVGPMGHQKNSEVTTLEEVKKWYSNTGDSEVIDKLSKLVKRIIPDLKVSRMQSKTRITCDSPTRLPYIDRITPTVAVAAVGNGLGATICDEVGRLAACLSVTGKWDSELPKSLFEIIFEKDD